MADIYEHNGKDGRFVIDNLVTGNYVLGGASQEMVGTLVLHVVVASGTISIIPKARGYLKGANRDNDHATFQPIPYTRRNVAATVSDDTTVSAAIAATGIFKVDLTGLEGSLEIVQTSGTGFIYWKVVQGAAA